MIITICNRKGGTGKSTTAINVAAVLAGSQKKVLLLDLDPQRNASQGLGVKEPQAKNVFTVLYEKHPIQEAIVHRYGIDLVPASEDLVKADTRFNDFSKREELIRKALRPVKDQYDFIIFDCSPHMGIMTTNALVASNYYIIPLQAEYFALEGLAEMLNSVYRIREDNEVDIQFGGVFLTRYISTKKLCREVAQTVEAKLGDKLFKTFIHENIRVAEAQANGMPIFQYVIQTEKESQAAADYIQLTNEILTKLNANGKAN